MGEPKPRPDFAAGVSSSAFTEEEISMYFSLHVLRETKSSIVIEISIEQIVKCTKQ
jgi:hypothetical protein